MSPEAWHIASGAGGILLHEHIEQIFLQFSAHTGSDLINMTSINFK